MWCAKPIPEKDNITYLNRTDNGYSENSKFRRWWQSLGRKLDKKCIEEAGAKKKYGSALKRLAWFYSDAYNMHRWLEAHTVAGKCTCSLIRAQLRENISEGGYESGGGTFPDIKFPKKKR